MCVSVCVQVMEKFSVDIRFPKDKDSSVVVIQGQEGNVEDAKEHLLTLAEDYVGGHYYIMQIFHSSLL